MGNAAAFFDLDRTLLGGASGPAISRAPKLVGLIPDRHIPGEDLVFQLFNVVGESRPGMMLAKQAVRMSQGWDVERAREAGRIAAGELIDEVQPYARILIKQHKAEGRKIVVATTTPDHLVRPLAELLGADDVVATTYEDRDGTFTGRFAGEFVWGKGKYQAVQAWSERNDVSLGESWAYSDSYYDVPLLSAVGHPVVVNPDPRMRVQALVRRWPTVYLDVPPRVPKLGGLEAQQVAMPFARPELVRYAKIQIRGTDHIPLHGPAIIVGNHRSYFDPLAVGYAIAQRGRPCRFLGKKEVFDAPIIGDLVRAAGGIRVDRGTGSDQPLEEAAQALRAGELVTLMPQGTIPRGKAFFDPELKGRWGAARLAAMSGAPVIPFGLWGTEKVWPRNARLPNVLNFVSPPTVTVTVGPPVEIGRIDPDADTRAIMAAIAALLPPEARVPHEPTREELARTLPSSYKGDPEDYEHEAARRPGTD